MRGCKTVEGDADKLELELLHDLYHGDHSPKHIIFCVIFTNYSRK